VEPKIEPFFQARILGVSVTLRSPLPLFAAILLAVVVFFVILRHHY
jgi:hypothetical protein